MALFKKDYDEIIRENFDLSDKFTRQYIISLDEDTEQDKLLYALSSSLYDNIVNKVDEIDFGTIPMSRGDITKVEKFNMTEDSLSIIRRLAVEYKQNPNIVDIITTAIQNIKDNKSIFIKGYALNVEFPMLMYNLITLCIIRSTSMIIATCVKYISDPQTKTLRQALDKVAYQQTQEDVMFKQLVTFNSLCKDGSIVKMLNASIKNNGKLKEDVELSRYDAPLDAIVPVQTTDEEDDVPIPSPFDTDNSVEPHVDLATPQVEPEAPVPDSKPELEVPAQEPVPGEEVPETPAPSSDELFDNPQQDELPVSEPEAPTSEPISDPPVEIEAPDVNPDPETDTDLTPSDRPISEEEPECVPPCEEPQQIANPSDTGGVNPVPQPSDTGVPGDTTDLAPQDEANAEDIVKNTAKVAGVIIGALAVFGAAKFTLFKIIIPGLRSIVYTLYYTAFKISDYWQIQAEFLEANADELEMSSDMDEDKKEKIIKKQRKWAETFRKWSNLFNLDKKKTEQQVRKAEDEDKKNKKKVKQDDNGDDVLF